MCACAVWLFVGSASSKRVVLGSPLSSGEQLMKQLQPSALMGRDFAAPAQHYPRKLSPEGGGCPGDPEEGRQLHRAISVGTPSGLSTRPSKNLLRTLPSITRGKSKAGGWTQGWAVQCLSLPIHLSTAHFWVPLSHWACCRHRDTFQMLCGCHWHCSSRRGRS